MRLTVVGAGYLGATHAACMAELGHEVLAMDSDAAKVAALQSGRAPFFEPGLDTLLKRHTVSGRLRFTTDLREARRRLREIESRVIAVAEWAGWHRIPTLIGEGWVGYTPLHGTFEESVAGRSLAEHGITTALAHVVWGVVLCSNAAPHAKS